MVSLGCKWLKYQAEFKRHTEPHSLRIRKIEPNSEGTRVDLGGRRIIKKKNAENIDQRLR
jgi:hypothetical protein